MEHPVFVARERELAELRGYLDRALAGRGEVLILVSDHEHGQNEQYRQHNAR